LLAALAYTGLTSLIFAFRSKNETAYYMLFIGKSKSLFILFGLISDAALLGKLQNQDGP